MVRKKKAKKRKVKSRAKVRKAKVRGRTKVTRVAKRQVGKSIKRKDKRRTALKPGLRKTASPHKHRGKTIKKSSTYSERRANRSDKNPSRGL